MSALLPGGAELAVILYVIVIVAGAHNLGRWGDGFGRLLERLLGGKS